MSRPLDPDVLLEVALSAICSRHRYTRHAEAAIAELRARAGDREDILAMETGKWAGYYEGHYTSFLTTAILAEIPDTARWAEIGRSRRAVPHTARRGSPPPVRSAQ